MSAAGVEPPLQDVPRDEVRTGNDTVPIALRLGANVYDGGAGVELTRGLLRRHAPQLRTRLRE
jgi:hypothetical protein